jgi:hypothetical protein
VLPAVPVVQLRQRFNYALEFYVDAPIVTIDRLQDTALVQKPYLLLLHRDDDSTGTKPIKTFEQFHISKLNKKFLDPKTRNAQLQELRLFLR